MIHKVIIKDNKKSPVSYLSNLDSFKNGAEFTFKPGVNIIVGENGSGKTTLMKLIEAYLMVGKEECGKGTYNSNIRRLFRHSFLGGVSVVADYEKNTFRLCHVAEKSDDDALKDFRNFGTFYEQRHASTGEGITIALNSLFKLMFSKEAKLRYDYHQFEDDYPQYIEYINSCKDTSVNEWTILMDEPDRNLDISNIGEIKGILGIHKDQTQVISVIHNPLLIVWASNQAHINIVEMTEGYVDRVKDFVRSMVNEEKCRAYERI